MVHDSKFFGNPNGKRSKPQQSTLAFKEADNSENTRVPVQNGVRQTRKQKVKDESQDSNSDQGAHAAEENDSSTPKKGDNKNLNKPEIVSEGLSDDECGSHSDMVLKSAALPLY